jgi:hypothetical protein
MSRVQHVDLVKNEWLAGFQVVVARAFIEGAELRVDTQEPQRWEPVLRRSFTDRESGVEVGPDRPEEFLGGLHEHLRGDYLFATGLHDDAECPFAERLVVPLKSVEQARELEPAGYGASVERRTHA